MAGGGEFPSQHLSGAQGGLHHSEGTGGAVVIIGEDRDRIVCSPCPVQVQSLPEHRIGPKWKSITERDKIFSLLAGGGQQDIPAAGGLQQLRQGEGEEDLGRVGGGADGDHLVLRVEGQGDQLPGGALQAQQLSRRLAQILGADGAVRPPPPDQQPAAVGVMGQQIRVAVPVQIQVVHQAGGVRQGERSPVGQTDLVFVPV